jgi:hypothetical protein
MMLHPTARSVSRSTLVKVKARSLPIYLVEYTNDKRPPAQAVEWLNSLIPPKLYNLHNDKNHSPLTHSFTLSFRSNR